MESAQGTSREVVLVALGIEVPVMAFAKGPNHHKAAVGSLRELPR